MRTFAATILACGVLAIKLREAGTETVQAEPMPATNAPLSPPVTTDDPNYVMPPTECTGATTDPAYCGPMEPGAQGAEIPMPPADGPQGPTADPGQTPPTECTGATTDPAYCGPMEPGAQGAEIPMPPADGPQGTLAPPVTTDDPNYVMPTGGSAPPEPAV